MAVEIERKWRVRHDAWRELATSSSRIVQGYLAASEGRSVRVRRRDDTATLTLKIGRDVLERTEVEVPLPPDEAERLLDPDLVLGALVDKTRHLVPLDGGLVAEVDEFHGANAGLVVAEVELPSRDADLEPPPWFGREVTDDPRYLNARLAVEPFGTWPADARD